MTTTPDLWRSPFIDNTSLTGNQESGVVAATSSDQFFAVWGDRLNFNQGHDTIIARKFDSLGNPLTGEVNLTGIGFSSFDADQPAAVRLPIAGQADGLAVAFTFQGDIYLVKADAALSESDRNTLIE